MNYTTVANATFILCGLSPIWVALFSVLVLRRRYRWLGWLGQAVGLGGRDDPGAGARRARRFGRGRDHRDRAAASATRRSR